VTNAVNFVNATYSTERGHALVAYRLYIPAEQVADEQQRTRMGIPAATAFKTKPHLGLELLTEQVAAGIHIGWCTADAVYGRDRTLRTYCETNSIGYVLGVPCSWQVQLTSGIVMRADATLTILTRPAWQIVSCGLGSKGERRYQLGVAGHRQPSPLSSDSPQPDQAHRGRVLLLPCPPPHPRYTRCPRRRRRAALDRRGRPRVQQGPVRLRPVPGPPVHPDHAAHHPGHRHPGRLRRDRRCRQGRRRATTDAH
jgi:hypothetical protein